MSKELLVQHDPFLDQVADILTKPLSTTHFGRLKSKFSVVSLTTLTLRRSIKACVIKVLRLGMTMRWSSSVELVCLSIAFWGNYHSDGGCEE